MHLFTPRSGGGTGGGGGGSSIIWEEAGNSPIRDVDNGVGIYEYEAGLGQSLYTAVRVPSTYVDGTQIFLKVLAYSGDNTGNILLRSTATLIRPEVDAITSTANEHTSTNSAISLSAGTVNEPQLIDLDLTDASGEINSVALTAGDLILIEFTRGTDTSTGPVQFIVQSAEATFT